MHKGTGGYSRNVPDISGLVCLCRKDVGKELSASMPAEDLNLPRAIKFTGALYSIGLPPEFIGTGTALEEARKSWGSARERLLKKYFLPSDLLCIRYLTNVASRFFQACLKETAKTLSDTFSLNQPEPSYRILPEMMQPDLAGRNEKLHG